MKRSTVLLMVLMMVRMVSFGATTIKEKLTPTFDDYIVGEDNHSDENPTIYTSGNSLNINDRYRFNQNRLEINGLLSLSENSVLEMRIRNDSAVGGGSNKISDWNTQKSDETEVRLRLHYKTPIEDFEVRTELQTNSYEDKGNKTYLKVQPSLILFSDTPEITSFFRAGLAMQDDRESHGQDYSVSAAFWIFYMMEYAAFEFGTYYDWIFAGDGALGGAKGGTGTYTNFQIEAYAYLNYPLYQNDDFKFEALLEGGLDPYGFGARHIGDLSNVSGSDVTGREYYAIYAEPSLKFSKNVSEKSNLYIQLGYYIDTNSTASHDDSMFGRIGFINKF